MTGHDDFDATFLKSISDTELLSPDLQPFLNRVELIQLTAKQIQKDFEMSGYEIEFSGNAGNAYNELFAQIMPIVEQLIKSDFEKLMQLIYRIDLNENKIKSARENENESYAALITHLIIQRQLQKVVTRKAFAKLNKDNTRSEQP